MKENTAKIVDWAACTACGWPVIHICCNDGCAETEPYDEFDWWGYCSNPTCQHHHGEEWGLYDAPSFVGVAT